MGNTFDWIELRTSDVHRTAGFFGQLFGWQVQQEITAEGSDYWIFDTGDEPRLENLRRGAFWLRPATERLGTVVYIHVDDIDAVLARVDALGGKVIAGKTAEGRALKAYFADPDGNVFGLWEDSGAT